MNTAVIFCCVLLVFGHAKGQNLNPSLFATRVNEIVEDSLKFSDMQSHLDSLSYSTQTTDGTALLSELSVTLGNKFRSRIATVQSVREAVVSAYGGNSANQMCCSLSSNILTQDTRFNQPVSDSHVCERVSSAVSSEAVRLSELFLAQCITNLQNTPALKWQYFGSEQGITTIFPAALFTDCSTYDNRFRPWYVEASVPDAKQVVIVIDTSGSMSQTDSSGVSFLSLARDAAKTVINTLNPYDKFAVVTFATTAQVFSSTIPNGDCYSSSFAQATPQNIARVEEFINGIQASGATYYSRALNSAFAYFSNNPTADRDRVILFMSDGEPTDDTAIETLNTLNDNVGNSVVLLTYGMGSGTDFSVLRNMANATSTQVGTIQKRGIFTQITTPSNLRNEMASYYTFFTVTGQVTDVPIWTVPYLDAFGLGLLITASLPVYINDNLVGVAAVDLTIEELLADVSFFKPTQTSYSFVINDRGLIINHPNFPYITNNDPLFVEATAFERDENFLSVFESMKRGDSGNKTFVSTKVLPQGDSTMYGVREVTVRSTYFWQQIPETTFSLCLVLVEEQTQALLQNQGSVSTGGFLYHRIDLVPPRQACHHSENYCSIGESSIALAARSFQDPELYLATEETAGDVNAIVDYMEGRSNNRVNIKEGIKNVVVATQIANQFWNSSSDGEVNRRVLWRYIGTSDGIFRNFPGTQMPSNFDPVLRDWYEHAQANPGKIAITPPYSDAASGESVITLTRVLFEGQSGGNHDALTDVSIGAMGVDIVTTYFYYLLQTEYPACGDGSYSCLLIDQGGFVIIAPQFLDENTNHYDRHLADLEPSVASVLIDNNVLQTKTCTNVASGLVQKTYFISSTQAFYSGTTGELNCRIFELSPLSGTNAFLLTIGTTVVPCVSVIHNCDCNLVSSPSGAIATPSCPSATLCTCPCTTYNTEFQPCYNNYSFTSSSPQPCTPETPELNLVATTTVDLSSLPVCYEIDFNSPGTSGSVSVGLIVGCVLGGIALLFFLGAWYDHHQRKKKSSALPSQTQTQSRPPPPPPQFTVQPTAPPTNHYQNVNFAPDQVNYVPPPPPYSSL